MAGARRLAQAEELAALARLYAIVDGPSLLQLEDEVGAWATVHAQSSVERAVALDRAYDSGLIAMLATALHDRKESSIRAKIFLAKDVEWDRRFGERFSWPEFIPTEDRTTEPADGEGGKSHANDIVSQVRSRIGELLDEYRSRKRHAGHRQHSEPAGVEAVEAYEAALKQIDWITRRFRNGSH